MGCSASVDSTATKPGRNTYTTSVTNGSSTGDKHPKQQSAYPTQPTKPTQANANSGPPQQPPQKQIVPLTMSKDLLLRYMELEKQINIYEGQNVVDSLRIKWEQLKEMTTKEQQLTKKVEECKAKTAKEKSDVDNLNQDSVRSFFQDQAAFDAQLSKEQEEYLEALSGQEAAVKECSTISQQKVQLDAEVQKLRTDATQLEKLYKDQDQLLASIFQGKYGSDKEWMLESEFDVAKVKQERVYQAKFRWEAARVLVFHASQQLGVAVQRWKQMMPITNDYNNFRYQLATETRNNLLSAVQNLTNAQRYLQQIEFPYCKPQEIQTLDLAMKHCYVDMQRPDRQTHALNCYTVTHQRSYALVMWFDQVLTSRIVKDLEEADKLLQTKLRELKMERVRLIQEKLTEELGSEAVIALDTDGNLTDAKALKAASRLAGHPKAPSWQKVEEEVVKPDPVQQVPDSVKPQAGGQAAAVEGAPAPSGGASTDIAPPEPTPLPLNELAPVPSQDELFGKMDQLRQRHEREMEEYSRAQDANKARLEQGLQERLRIRRSRQTRQENTSGTSGVTSVLQESSVNP